MVYFFLKQQRWSGKGKRYHEAHLEIFTLILINSAVLDTLFNCPLFQFQYVEVFKICPSEVSRYGRNIST